MNEDEMARLRRKVCIRCETPSISLLCVDCSVEEFRERRTNPDPESIGAREDMMNECRCERISKGVLRSGSEGEGLSLYCAVCDGWVEDAWLFTDEGGIPVSVETEESRDYASGEILTYYGLAAEVGTS